MMEPKRAREGIASSFTNRDTRPAEAARFPAGRWWVAAGPRRAQEALGRGGGRPPAHPVTPASPGLRDAGLRTEATRPASPPCHRGEP